MRARAIMVLGTSSHVGKSLLTAALCRIFAQQGYRVAPFKSQNMSLNSAATLEGLEIGRAQALQAEAAGVLASVHMNPILLKPSGNMSSQVIVRGKIWGQLTAADYHQRRVEELMPIVRESYEILAAQNEVIILEGAGSPAEINLKQHDIVNMRMAELADAACVLVGDIDCGGVFGSLLGTVLLLDPAEQARIRGFLINKFRGDVSLLRRGVVMMEERLTKPCLGVVPYISDLLLDEEDSLGLPRGDFSGAAWESGDSSRPLRIAVIAFPSFSNFTDFDSLRSEPSVSLRFCRQGSELTIADVVILPGSKQTVDDLLWMRTEGIESGLMDYSQTGLVVGVCGGMQMLGEHIVDPSGVEHEGATRGLGLLPLRTEMQPRKITSITSGATLAPTLFGQAIPSLQLTGYEIHIGDSEILSGGQAFAQLHRASQPQQPGFDGCVSADSRIFGTYLHGLFDEDSFRHAFLTAARKFHGLTPAPVMDNWKSKREESLNRLANTVRASLEMERIFSWVGLPYDRSSPAEDLHR
jgi:adenosylcobyric acid synthase